MKKSLFSRLFKRNSRSLDAGRITPEDIRQKLVEYQKREGRAVFGGARLYAVEEVEQPDILKAVPDQEPV